MRRSLPAAVLALLAFAPAHANVIKTFDVDVTFPTNRYPVQITGTATIDTTAQVFTAINLTLAYFFTYTGYTTFTPYGTATDFGFVATQDNPGPVPFQIGLELARSSLGADPTAYTGGPLDPAGTFYSNSGGTRPTPDYAMLSFVPGSTVVTPVGNIPEPATLALFGTGLAAMAAARRRRRRGGAA